MKNFSIKFLDDQKEQHKCPKCDYTTPWKSSIATHMKLKHSSKSTQNLRLYSNFHFFTSVIILKSFPKLKKSFPLQKTGRTFYFLRKKKFLFLMSFEIFELSWSGVRIPDSDKSVRQKVRYSQMALQTRITCQNPASHFYTTKLHYIISL